MSYSSNQYNYATPLSSAAGLTNETYTGTDRKYFTLSDNVLDGTYTPIVGDVGIWGTSVASSDGTLSLPFVITVTDNLTINAIKLTFSQYAYPKAFTIQFYNGNNLLYTITETDNDEYIYTNYLQSTITCTRYVITITKLNREGVTARLYNTYNVPYVKRVDTLVLGASDNTIAVTEVVRVFSVDSIKLSVHEGTSHITNSMVSSDIGAISSVDKASLRNVHSIMKAPSRRIYGKVLITYTDPMIERGAMLVTTSSEAYNSNSSQVTDGITRAADKFFTLYDNDLSGAYSVSSEASQVGWTSSVISDSDGYFAKPPYLELNVTPRPIKELSVHLDDTHNNILKDFDVILTTTSDEAYTVSFNDNNAVDVLVPLPYENINIVSIKILVYRVNRAHSPATIIDIPTMSTFVYEGYQERSDLISIDMLEELTYEDDVEALGGVSANEVTVSLDNSTRLFNSTNRASPVFGQLKRNRKIVPYLGVEVVPDEIEWHTLGTYWSYEWDVPYNSLIAKVIGFDTIGLLDTTSFTNHTLMLDRSIGELIDYVLNDAKEVLTFLEWTVDESLYNVRIPYAWFEPRSHTAALRRISQCYPMHIYCDRSGRICAAPQKLHLDVSYDTWSDDTNIYDKSYSALNSTLPNIVNVTVNNPTLVYDELLVKDEFVFNVATMNTRTLLFTKPYVADLVGTVDMDASVRYTYEVYSWGIQMHFTGTGFVRSISCVGTALDTSNTSVITRRDEQSIYYNGAITRDISANFIQTDSLALYIINRYIELSTYDIYDAEVSYRGNIALSINDPIVLLDGIAPDNRYNIKRHRLTWDGGLSGVADLNT